MYAYMGKLISAVYIRSEIAYYVTHLREAYEELKSIFLFYLVTEAKTDIQ